MNGLDLTALLLAALGFYWGFQKGILAALLGWIGLLLGLILAMKTASLLGVYLMKWEEIPPAWIPAISYLLLFVGVILLVRLLTKALESLISTLRWNGINRLMGGLAYAAMALLFWSTLLWLGHQMHLFPPETLAHSQSYPYLAPLPSRLLEAIGQYWPMVDSILDDLSQFFDRINQKLPEHVGAHRPL